MGKEENTSQEEEQVESLEEVGLEPEQIIAMVEALLFAHSEPMSVARLVELLQIESAEIKKAIEVLEDRYAEPDSGLELKTVKGGYQMRTKEVLSDTIRQLKAGRPRKLSPAALETLAIIAYRQPVVKSDIEKIRGVDATPTLKTLLDKKLAKIVGHQPTVGQPALYGTTDEFLKLFGLESLDQLPTLRDLKELEEVPADDLMDEEESGEPSAEMDQEEMEEGSAEDANQEDQAQETEEDESVSEAA